MLLNELFEGETKHVTFCFGRMNPPTIGHKQVLDTMKSQGGDMKVFVSQTQDKKKNPLDYSTKINFIKEMFPQYASNVVEDASLNTVVKVASYLFEQGYNAATFVAGSDRLEDMKKLLEQYNGVEGKAHGYYKFDVIDFVSSGEREDGAEGIAGISASGAREAAANGNFEKFKEATGAGGLAQDLYNAVRKGMGIKDSVKESISEAPIEMDPADPMDPMIYGHEKANPGKLKYRMMRAAGQIKDLASRVDNASPAEWQLITRQFDELKMNVDQIRHALDELAKVRKKGGIRSRGIDTMIDSIGEGIMRAYQIIENKKDRKAKKYNIKPRTGHAPTQTGAGAHKDLKKAQKQGYEKHKSKVEETELRDKADLQAKRKALQDLQSDPTIGNDKELSAAVMQRKADLEREAKAKGMAEGRHGYDDMGYSLAPGHDEGEPVYNPRYDVVGRGNDRHWQPDRDQYAPRREKKGFVFYNVKDPDLASQVGLKQTKGGKWYAFTTDRFLNKSAEREFGPGKVWYPKD